jgi:uncharacterized protein (UPF0332 family)
MKTKDAQELIEHRLEKSSKSITAAELMLEKDMPAFAMNRVYYSMFYAIQALLILRNASFSKHGQLKGYFNREFIKTGILPKEIGQVFNKAFEYRQKYDYVDFASPDREMVSEYITRAKKFHSTLSDYIKEEMS